MDRYNRASGGTNGCLRKGSCDITDSTKDLMNVTTWDIKGQQSHHFPIEINRGFSHDMNNYFVIITSGEQSIVFFERILNKSSWVRMNLQRQIEYSRCIEHANIKGYSMHSENTMPAYTTGPVTLWS